jgi:GTP-binding protein YchF
MKIGLVGYQGSGKSTLFEWLTGQAPDLSLKHSTQSAMATVPDERVAGLCEIYKPKKVTQAALEIVDTAGLSRKHEGNAARLALIREAGCLVQVVAAFDGSDPAADLHSFAEDLLLADLEIVTGRLERLREAVKKPRPNRAEQEAELQCLEPILAQLEDGNSLADTEFSKEQEKFTRSFGLLTRKRRLGLINVGDDETDLKQYDETLSTDRVKVLAVPVGLEQELARMTANEAAEFRAEMGLEGFDRDGLIRTLMDLSGQMLFFTAGEKEVRTWMVPQGATALEAADSIHSDLARGFIRAETMCCADLLRLGSEREVKAQNLMRQETKDYVLQDGDILNIRFSV